MEKENKLSKSEIKICVNCSKEFKTTLKNKICCCDKCLSKYRALNLQKLYDEGKIKHNYICEEAFYEIINFIKGELYVELIRKGHFINGVRQNNYSNNELLDCYIYVMNHVFGKHYKRSGKKSYVEYDPNRINKKTGERILLASFINSWTKGYCSLVRQTQRNIHKINKHRILSLEEVIETFTPEDLIEYSLTDNINNNLEYDIFKDNNFININKELIEQIEDIKIFND